MVVNPGKDIVVVGSGTAGLLSALFFKKNFLNSNVSVIRSKEIGVIGVGESTTPIIVDFLRYLEVDLYDFFCNTNATIKYGIKFNNWGNVDFYHGFLPKPLDFENIDVIKNGINKKDFYSHINPFNVLMKEKKISVENNSLLKNFAFHFDNSKTIDFLEKICLLRNIKIIDDTIMTVNINFLENVEMLVGKKDSYKCTFVIDCTGQNRLLCKIYNKKFKEYNDLLIDRGMPCISKKLYVENYTSATALNNGWCWKIPTYERTGIGYVYSSKFTSDEKAFYELKNIVDAETYRTIKFTPGRFQENLFKNVLLIGLSSHFLEPLEATNLKTVVLSLNLFLSEKNINTFNEKLGNIIDDIKTFILFHYLTTKKEIPFWNQMYNNAIKNERVKNIINDINNKYYSNFFDYEEKFSTSNYILFMQNYNILKKTDFNLTDKNYFLKKHIIKQSLNYNECLKMIRNKSILL